MITEISLDPGTLEFNFVSDIPLDRWCIRRHHLDVRSEPTTCFSITPGQKPGIGRFSIACALSGYIAELARLYPRESWYKEGLELQVEFLRIGKINPVEIIAPLLKARDPGLGSRILERFQPDPSHVRTIRLNPIDHPLLRDALQSAMPDKKVQTPTPTEQSTTITTTDKKKEHGIMKEQEPKEPTGPTAPVTAPAVLTTTTYKARITDGKLFLSELPVGAISIMIGIDNETGGPVVVRCNVLTDEIVPSHGEIILDLGILLRSKTLNMCAGHPKVDKGYSLVVLPHDASGTKFEKTSLPISGEELAKLLAPPTGDTTVVITPPPTPLATIGPKPADEHPAEVPLTATPTPPAPTTPVAGTAPVTPPAPTAPTAPTVKMVPEKSRAEMRNELKRVFKNITHSLENPVVLANELAEDQADTDRLQHRLKELNALFPNDTATLMEFSGRFAEIQARLAAEKKKFDDAEILRKSAVEQSARLAKLLAEKDALAEQNAKQAKQLQDQQEALATAQAQAAAAAKAPSPAPAPTPAPSSINNPPPPDKPPGDGDEGGSGDGGKDKNSKGDADKGKGNSSSLINTLLTIIVTALMMVFLFLFARNNNWLGKMDSSPTAAEKAKLEEDKLALQAEKARLGSEWTNIMGMHIATTNKINELDARVALIKSLQTNGQVAGLVVPTAPPGSFQAIGWTNVSNGNNNTNSIIIIGNGNIVIQPTNTVVIPQTPPHACKVKGNCTSCTDDGDDDWLQSIPKNASVNADGTRSWEVTLRPGMRCDYRVDPRRCEIVYKYNYRVNRQNIDDVEFYEINMQGIPVRIKLGDPNHSTPPEGVLGHSYIVGPRVVGEVHLQFTARRI